jgi:zinc transport system substrate-binding protein
VIIERFSMAIIERFSMARIESLAPSQHTFSGRPVQSHSPVSNPLTRSLWVAAIALSLGACTPPSDRVSRDTSERPNATSAEAGKALEIVTTFLPMTQFTKAVAGDRAQVTQLLPRNLSPHDYQAKPTDAQRLATADVLIHNGLEFENFLEPMIENAGHSGLSVIDTSKGIEVLAIDQKGKEHAVEEHTAEEHVKETSKTRDPSRPNSAQAAKEAGTEEHGAFDPHIWLDPIRAIAQVENIRDGLIATDPAGQVIYTANAAAYVGKLKALDQEIRMDLAPFAGKTFVTFHDFSTYFARRYGLKAEFLVNVPEESPSPGDVKRVLEAAQASDLKTLLTDSEASSGAFRALAEDLGVKVSTFKPNEVGDVNSIEPDAYLRVMRENVANLKTAFSAP